MMNRSLFMILTAFILGILLAEYGDPSPIFLLIAVPVVLSLVCLKAFERFKAGFIFFVFLCLGALGHSLLMNSIPEDHLLWRVDPKTKSTLTGRVISFPERFPDKVRLLLSAETYEGKRASGIVQLSIYPSSSQKREADQVDIDYGDRIKVTGKFRPPRNAKNPGAFDYVSFLKRKGVRVIGSTSARHVEVVEKGRGNRFVSRVLGIKKSFHSFLDSSLPESEAAMIKALITGDRGGVSDPVRDRFARAGAAHLLAISGLHMGFTAFFFYQLFLFIFRFVMPLPLLRRSYFWFMPSRLASISTLVFIPFYTLLAGGRTSSVRAAIMIVVFLSSKILERQRDLLQTLILAALIILVWRPSSLFEVDFQLSFTAVTAMVLYLKHLRKPEDDIDPLQRYQSAANDQGIVQKISQKPAQLFLMTFLAMTATAPITAAVFHRVSLAGILTNLLFVPLTGLLIVPMGLASLLLFMVSPALAVWPAKAAGIGTSLLAQGVDLVGSLKWAAAWVFPPPMLLIVLYYLFFFIFLLLPRFGTVRRFGGILVLSICFFVCTEWSGAIREDGRLHIRFLDVGQGSAVLLILPDAKTVLIDGGGSYLSSSDVGRKVVLPALLSQGIREIDVMVLTHPHPDHMNGLNGILEEIPAGEVWDVWKVYPSENYRQFRKIISERRIPRRFLNRKGEKIYIGNVLFEVLHHGSGDKHGANSEVNNDSLVLKVSFGDVSLLVTGDLEEEGEKSLIEHYPMKLKSTILQVPHHGSISSSTPVFLDRVQPEIAVIQAGGYNRFRFPSREVLGRYLYIFPEKRLLRTDQDGSVWIRTDGKTVQVKRFSDL